MRNDVTTLDAYIAGPEQRDLTRLIRFILYITEFHNHVLVFGDTDSTKQLLPLLTLIHPDPYRHVAFVENTATGPATRLSYDGPVTPVPGATVQDLIRALLRQDPDVIGLNGVPTSEAVELLMNAALTGHQIFYSAPVTNLSEALQALATTSPDAAKLAQHVRPGVVIQVAGDTGYIERVWYRSVGGELQEVAHVEGADVVVHREWLPAVPVPTAPLHTPVFAAPVEVWPPAETDPRPAFIPVTAAIGNSRSRIGGNRALLPVGEAWPVCKSCGLPLTLTVQLDLAALPESFRQTGGIAQLFICNQNGGGCGAFSETDAGVLAVVRSDELLQEVAAPEEYKDMAIAPGTIVDWRPFTEEPGYGDAPELSEAEPQRAADNAKVARHLDKLGGWPAWQQSNDWPLNADGSRMTLLYQIAEGELRMGGTSSGWDYENAVHIPNDPGTRIIDPNKPHHFYSLWSGDAVGMLFIDATGTKLVLRVQMT